jgi:hypothetical protein
MSRLPPIPRQLSAALGIIAFGAGGILFVAANVALYEVWVLLVDSDAMLGSGAPLLVTMLDLVIALVLGYGFLYLTSLRPSEQRFLDIGEKLVNIIVTVFGLFALAFYFGLVCRYWYYAYGGFISPDGIHHVSRTTEWTGWLQADWPYFWPWVWFGLVQVGNALTFNISQVFGWHPTDIQATDVGSRFVVWAFTVALQVVAIAAVLQAVKNLLRNPWRALKNNLWKRMNA